MYPETKMVNIKMIQPFLFFCLISVSSYLLKLSCIEHRRVFMGHSHGHLLSYNRSHFKDWLGSKQPQGIFYVCFWSTVLSFLKRSTSFLKYPYSWPMACILLSQPRWRSPGTPSLYLPCILGALASLPLGWLEVGSPSCELIPRLCPVSYPLL